MPTTLTTSGSSEGGVGEVGVDEVGGVVGDSGSSDNTTTWSVGGAQLSSDRVGSRVLVLSSSSARKSLGKSSRA